MRSTLYVFAISVLLFWIGLFLFLAPVVIFVIQDAEAHEAYTGVKNAAGQDCCGGNDCAIYTGPVREVKDGWMVEEELVKREFGIQSFDANYHRCIVGNKTRCFLVPGTN